MFSQRIFLKTNFIYLFDHGIRANDPYAVRLAGQQLAFCCRSPYQRMLQLWPLGRERQARERDAELSPEP